MPEVRGLIHEYYTPSKVTDEVARALRPLIPAPAHPCARWPRRQGAHPGASLSLTPRGEALVSRAREMLALAEATRLERRSELPAGTLRVSVPVPLGRMLVGPVIARFRQRLPSVALEIRLENTRVDLVRDGIDLAIRGGRLSDSALISRKLSTASLRRCCSTSYREAPAGEIPLILALGDAALLRRAGLPHEPSAVDDRTAVADALVVQSTMAVRRASTAMMVRVIPKKSASSAIAMLSAGPRGRGRSRLPAAVTSVPHDDDGDKHGRSDQSSNRPRREIGGRGTYNGGATEDQENTVRKVLY